MTIASSFWARCVLLVLVAAAFVLGGRRTARCEGAVSTTSLRWLISFRNITRPYNQSLPGAVPNPKPRLFASLRNQTSAASRLRRAACGRHGEPVCSKQMQLPDMAELPAVIFKLDEPLFWNRTLGQVKEKLFCPGADVEQLLETTNMRSCVEACIKNTRCAAAAMQLHHSRGVEQCHLKRLGFHCVPVVSFNDSIWMKPGVQEYQSKLPVRGPEKAQVLGKMAVVVPIRNRKHQESLFVSTVPVALREQYPSTDSFNIVFIEQDDGYLFNRGALLDTALLHFLASDYDWICVHDVDTLPKPGGLLYDQHTNAVTHVTPGWAHPVYWKATMYFGGNVIFPKDILRQINGFPVDLWGWGQEDDATRHRLMLLKRWPPEQAYLHSLEGRKNQYLDMLFVDHRYDGHTARSLRPFWALPDYPGGLEDLVSWTIQISSDFNSTILRISTHIFCDSKLTPWCIPKPKEDLVD